MKKLFPVIVIAGLVVVVGGYFYLTSVKQDNDSQKDNGKNISITSESGDIVSVGGELPDDLPADIPIYPGSSVDTSFLSNDGGIIIGLETDDGIEDVSDYYRGEFEENGWMVSVLDVEEGIIFSMEKEGRSGATGIVEDENGKTLISITVGIGEEREEL